LAVQINGKLLKRDCPRMCILCTYRKLFRMISVNRLFIQYLDLLDV